MRTEKSPFQRSRVRLGRIRYVNLDPVYFDLDRDPAPFGMEMLSGPPAQLNQMLAEGELDISPVSSAAYAKHYGDWLLLPDLSISCAGAVMSVLLVSRRPFDGLSGARVVLTEESATAAALLRLLFAQRGIVPEFETGKITSPQAMDADAALVIGDAALRWDWGEHFSHVVDLGQMWYAQTGLPFVFAVWAVRREYAEAFPELVVRAAAALNRSKKSGEGALEEIVPAAAARLGLDRSRCRHYYELLGYDLDPLRIKGLKAFFNGLFLQGLIRDSVELSFFEAADSAAAHVRAA